MNVQKAHVAKMLTALTPLVVLPACVSKTLLGTRTLNALVSTQQKHEKITNTYHYHYAFYS